MMVVNPMDCQVLTMVRMTGQYCGLVYQEIPLIPRPFRMVLLTSPVSGAR